MSGNSLSVPLRLVGTDKSSLFRIRSVNFTLCPAVFQKPGTEIEFIAEETTKAGASNEETDIIVETAKDRRTLTMRGDASVIKA